MTPAEQIQAIRRMRENRRRELAYRPAPGVKFVPGMSTARYVALFTIGHADTVLDVSCPNWNRPATLPEAGCVN